MLDELKRFFKGFVYAGRGIAYGVKTQRNFRFHLAAAVWVLALSRFYSFGRTEYAVLLLTIALVIVSEAVNTAIESAVDLCTEEHRRLAEAAKDTAAGAVLAASVFAVGVGFCLFWDMTVFGEILSFMNASPLRWLIAAVMAVLSFLFVFSERKDKK